MQTSFVGLLTYNVISATFRPAFILREGASQEQEIAMTSHVTEIQAAEPADAARHFSSKLTFETDCWDVHASLKSGDADFVLLDVRGREAYLAGHVPGALHLPRGKMIERRMKEWPQGTLFVTYCAGPHCNGADRAALHISGLGLPVKIMIGGATGWIDEGFQMATGEFPQDAKDFP
jgi:rhodanese-related sulfurtransferase